LLLAGIALLAFYLGAQAHSFLLSRIALWGIEEAQVDAASNASNSAEGQKADFSLWDKARIKSYRASLALAVQPPIAILSIRRLQLKVPVFDGTDDLILNRGLGRITGSAKPGSDGNLAIAGHRDGFFRVLKDVQLGDVVEIGTTAEKDTYVVDRTTIVDPRDTSVLEPESRTSLTLVTCYPFYFIGDAPQRFIVKASLKQREFLQASAGKPEQK
jgi:sortase A